MLPNFLFLGPPKSASTYLYGILREHPEVDMGCAKELNYFSTLSDGYPKWGPKDDAHYLSHYSNDKPFRVRGETATWYLYAPNAAALIRERLPNAKLMVCLRHPVDRAFSMYQFKRGGMMPPIERLPTFEQAIAAEPERIAGKLWDFAYLDVGRYARQIERYLERFPREQVHITLYDDLRADEAGFVRKVLQFLEIDSTFTPPKKEKANASKPIRSTAVKDFLLGTNPVKSALKAIVPTGLRRGIKSRAEALNQTGGPVLTTEFRGELTHRLRDDILRLQDLIHRDLNHWLEG